MNIKVKVIYGVFGGDHIGRYMRKALRDAGYQVVYDIAEADVIMAHSAGCYWLPPASSGQKYLFVDPPYWPGRSTWSRIRARARHNMQPWKYSYSWRRWALRNLWGVYYAVVDFRRNARVILHHHNFDLPEAIRGRQVVLVRNDHDDWLTPDLSALEHGDPPIRVVTTPGDHDDFNYHPERYVDLIRLLYE